MNDEKKKLATLEEMEWPAPEHILGETDNGQTFINATMQIELANETFGPNGWKAEIATRAKIVNDEFYSTPTKEMRAVTATAGARVTVQTEEGELVRESVGSSTARAERKESNGISVIEQALKTAWTNARKRAFSDIGRRFGFGVSKSRKNELAAKAKDAAVKAMKAADRILPGLEEEYAQALKENSRGVAKEIGARIGERLREAARVNPATSTQWREDWRVRLENTRREARSGT